MRAVNLMPVDPRRARARGVDRPLGAYVLLAVLALLVVFAAVWTMAGRQVDDRAAQLDRVTAEARDAEMRVIGSAKYEQFAELARKRVATVTSLSATRFDWALALREISRVLPGDAWLMQLNGSSGAAVDAAASEPSAAPAPSFEIQGCTRSQAGVARLMARLRAVARVRSVQLSSSTKPDTGSSDQCPANRPSDPLFTIIVKFAAPGESRPDVDSTGQVGSASPAAPPAATDGSPAAPAAPAAPAKNSPAVPAGSGSAPKSGATSLDNAPKGTG